MICASRYERIPDSVPTDLLYPVKDVESKVQSFVNSKVRELGKFSTEKMDYVQARQSSPAEYHPISYLTYRLCHHLFCMSRPQEGFAIFSLKV